MSEPTSSAPTRPVAAWKVWCTVAALTLVLVGGSAVIIQLGFNSKPTSSENVGKN